MKSFFFICLAFSVFITRYTSFTRGAYDPECNVGLNYGTQADYLPTPDKGLDPLREVVWRFRLLSPNIAILNYFNRTDGVFIVSMGTLNEEIKKIAVDQDYANSWVQLNVIAFPNIIFSHIVVGNEVIPGPIGNFVLQAMINMEKALKNWGNRHGTYVTTAVAMNVLKTSYPPSAGVFGEDSMKVMRGVVNFLQTWGYPLFLNVYPYFAYANNPVEIRLDYALFNTTDVVVQDGELQYSNLFYAMVDSVIWALEKAGGPDVEIVVSETGWPSAGNGDLTTVEHARMYVNNLIATQMKSGTPKRPQHAMKTHIFAMYNENLKPEGVERNFGIYRPDLSEVYHVDWPKWSGRCNLENIFHK